MKKAQVQFEDSRGNNVRDKELESDDPLMKGKDTIEHHSECYGFYWLGL